MKYKIMFRKPNISSQEALDIWNKYNLIDKSLKQNLSIHDFSSDSAYKIFDFESDLGLKAVNQIFTDMNSPFGFLLWPTGVKKEG